MDGTPRNKILTGDCLDLMATWSTGSVDHCIADPPFGISSGSRKRTRAGLSWAFSSHVTISEDWDSFTKDEFFRFNVDWLSEICRLVKPNGNILIFGTYHNIYQLGFILQSILNRKIINSIVWYKPNAQPNITARSLTESTEHIIWAVNSTPEEAQGWTFNYWDAKALNGDKQMRNVWFEDSEFWDNPVVPQAERKFGHHPSQKPLAITDRIVAIASRPGDLIIDPFVGTGAVGVSCLRLMRDYILIDSDKRYTTIAEQRLLEESERLGVFARDKTLMCLSDVERRLLQEVPIPQADNLSLVFEIPDFVNQGLTSRVAISKELQYAPRQGPYYADAAMALGLIADDRFVGRTGRVLNLTEAGKYYLALTEAERAFARRTIVLGAPILKFVAHRLGVAKAGESVPYPVPESMLDEGEVARVLGSLGASNSTARRRAQTLVRWLHDI